MSLGGDSIPQGGHEDSNEGSAVRGGHGPQMLQAQQHQFGGYPPPSEVEVPLHPNVLNPPPMENNQHMVRSLKEKKLKHYLNIVALLSTPPPTVGPNWIFYACAYLKKRIFRF